MKSCISDDIITVGSIIINDDRLSMLSSPKAMQVNLMMDKSSDQMEQRSDGGGWKFGTDVSCCKSQPALIAGGSVCGGASLTVFQVFVPASPSVRATTYQSSRVPEELQATIVPQDSTNCYTLVCFTNPKSTHDSPFEIKLTIYHILPTHTAEP